MADCYINIEYGELHHFMLANRVGQATLFRSKHNGTMFDELWFVVNSHGVVILHRYTGRPDDLDSYLAKEYDEKQGYEPPTIFDAEFHWRKE